jgi:hypothetical protein
MSQEVIDLMNENHRLKVALKEMPWPAHIIPLNIERTPTQDALEKIRQLPSFDLGDDGQPWTPSPMMVQCSIGEGEYIRKSDVILIIKSLS